MRRKMPVICQLPLLLRQPCRDAAGFGWDNGSSEIPGPTSYQSARLCQAKCESPLTASAEIHNSGKIEAFLLFSLSVLPSWYF